MKRPSGVWVIATLAAVAAVSLVVFALASDRVRSAWWEMRIRRADPYERHEIIEKLLTSPRPAWAERLLSRLLAVEPGALGVSVTASTRPNEYGYAKLSFVVTNEGKREVFLDGSSLMPHRSKHFMTLSVPVMPDHAFRACVHLAPGEAWRHDTSLYVPCEFDLICTDVGGHSFKDPSWSILHLLPKTPLARFSVVTATADPLTLRFIPVPISPSEEDGGK